MYALDSVRFGKSEEIIGFYLQMWICNLFYFWSIFITPVVLLFHQLKLLTWLCFVLSSIWYLLLNVQAIEILRQMFYTQWFFDF